MAAVVASDVANVAQAVAGAAGLRSNWPHAIVAVAAVVAAPWESWRAPPRRRVRLSSRDFRRRRSTTRRRCLERRFRCHESEGDDDADEVDDCADDSSFCSSFPHSTVVVVVVVVVVRYS